jgi:hypothetical protein
MNRPARASLLRSLRTALRLSTVARTLWLLVAALHVYLIIRRVAVGDWTTPLDYARAALCLLGVGYASLKFWRIATLFDSNLRRALAFGLLLFVGHWVIAQPVHAPAGGTDGQANLMALIAVLPALGASILGTIALLRLARHSTPPVRVVVTAHPVFNFSPLSLSLFKFLPSLFRRPPPCRA